MKTSTQNVQNRMNDDQISSFRDGHSSISLIKGTVLHRFARPRFPYSDCWMDEETFIPLINGIQRAGYQRSEKDKRNEIRNELAIKEAWNPLTHRVKVIIKEPVIAYYGMIGPQSEWIGAESRGHSTSQKKIEYRLGGRMQYVIPFYKDKAFLSNPDKYIETVLFQPIFKARYMNMDRWNRKS